MAHVASASQPITFVKMPQATVEQVLDPRTMQVLGKFLKRGLFATTSANLHEKRKELQTVSAVVPGNRWCVSSVAMP